MVLKGRGCSRARYPCRTSRDSPCGAISHVSLQSIYCNSCASPRWLVNKRLYLCLSVAENVVCQAAHLLTAVCCRNRYHAHLLNNLTHDLAISMFPIDIECLFLCVHRWVRPTLKRNKNRLLFIIKKKSQYSLVKRRVYRLPYGLQFLSLNITSKSISLESQRLKQAFTIVQTRPTINVAFIA